MIRKTILVLALAVFTAAAVQVAAAATPGTTTATTTIAAAPKATTHVHWFAGAVSGVGNSSLTIDVLWTGPHDGSLDNSDVTVAVEPATQITYGKDKTPIALSSLQQGDLIGIHAAGSDLSSLSALRIHAFCNCHWIGGTIASLGSNSLTVQVRRTGPYDTVLAGQSVPIQTGGSTVYVYGKDKTPIQFSDLKTGEAVGVVFAANGFFRAPGFDWTKATFTVKQVHAWGAHHKPPSPATDAAQAAQTT